MNASPQDIEIIDCIKGQQQLHIFKNAVLGKGQFGIVYKSQIVNQNKPSDTYSATKIIAMRSNNQIDMQREFEIVKSIRGEYIASVYFAIIYKQQLYIVSEYCQQGTLDQYCQKRKLSLIEKMELFQKISIGYFESLYKKNIIHRDLKQENILMHNDIPKITDFGLAKYTQNNDEGQEHTANKGTPLFSSPQVYKGDIYSYKADIYSLGVVLYKLIFNQNPNQITKQLQLFKFITALSELPIEQVLTFDESQKVPQCIKELIFKMMKNNENDRVTIQQLLLEIQYVINQLKNDSNSQQYQQKPNLNQQLQLPSLQSQSQEDQGQQNSRDSNNNPTSVVSTNSSSQGQSQTKNSTYMPVTPKKEFQETPQGPPTNNQSSSENPIETLNQVLINQKLKSKNTTFIFNNQQNIQEMQKQIYQQPMQYPQPQQQQQNLLNQNNKELQKPPITFLQNPQQPMQQAQPQQQQQQFYIQSNQELQKRQTIVQPPPSLLQQQFQAQIYQVQQQQTIPISNQQQNIQYPQPLQQQQFQFQQQQIQQQQQKPQQGYRNYTIQDFSKLNLNQPIQNKNEVQIQNEQQQYQINQIFKQYSSEPNQQQQHQPRAGNFGSYFIQNNNDGRQQNQGQYLNNNNNNINNNINNINNNNNNPQYQQQNNNNNNNYKNQTQYNFQQKINNNK